MFGLQSKRALMGPPLRLHLCWILFLVIVNSLGVTGQSTYNFCDDDTYFTVPIDSSSVITLRSPGYGNGSYNNNQHCAIVLSSGPEPLVLTFQFNVFSLEAAYDCGFDSTCIFGSLFCGDWLSGRNLTYFLPESSESTLVFSSDDSYASFGFEFIITTEVASYGQTIEEVTEGSYPSYINVSEVTFEPGFEYQDSCKFEHPESTYYFCEDDTYFTVPIDSSSVITLRSPGYDNGSYNNNQYCAIVLKSGPEPLVLTFQFNNFSLESAYACGFDSLCIFGSLFCGDWLSGRNLTYFLPEYSESTLVFSSDYSDIYSGFEFIITTEVASYGQTIEEVRGGFGSDPSNINISDVTFLPGFEYQDSCTFVPPRSTYYFCDDDNFFTVPIDSSSVITLRSPGYDNGSYNNNQYCAIVLSSGPEPLVLTFQFNDFFLEAQSACGFDSVCIFGTLFCGYWLSGRNLTYFLPEYSVSTLVFSSDYSVTYSGFEFIITTEVASYGQTIEEVTGGFGSDPSNTNISDVTFVPGFEYQDSCTFVPPREIYYVCSNDVTVVNVDESTAPFYIYSHENIVYAYYDNNLHCSLVIRSTDTPVILNFNYTYFNVEYEDSCKYDFLCVYGTAFCGGWPSGGYEFNYILPPDSNFTLVFKTDSTDQFDGFGISVVPQRANATDFILEVVGGVGSEPERLDFAYLSYEPEFAYVDRCSIPPPPTCNIPPEPYTETYYFCPGYCDPNVVYVDESTPPFLLQTKTGSDGLYPNGKLCSFVIRSGNRPVILSLYFQSFNLELESSCLHDSLCAHGVLLCGKWLSGRTFTYILPQDNHFTLTFTSDYIVAHTGFQIIVSVEPTFYGQTIQEIQGGVGSSEDNLYIETVTFLPGYNYLDGCLDAANSTVSISSNSFQEFFVPAPSYQFCDCSQLNLQIGPDLPEFSIRSPNFGGGFYYPNQNCPLTLHTGEEPVILNFKFNHFQVEPAYYCYYDWLCVNGARLCGVWATGYTFQFLVPENSTFTLIFNSNLYTEYNGFQIQVTQETAYNKSVAQPSGGDGSTNYGLYYDYQSYYPGIYYVDRCLQDSEYPADILEKLEPPLADSVKVKPARILEQKPTNLFKPNLQP